MSLLPFEGQVSVGLPLTQALSFLFLLIFIILTSGLMAFFFNATLRDWAAESKNYAELREVFQAAEIVRIVGRDTDLVFSTKGRIYVVADGHLNNSKI